MKVQLLKVGQHVTVRQMLNNPNNIFGSNAVVIEVDVEGNRVKLLFTRTNTEHWMNPLRVLKIKEQR